MHYEGVPGEYSICRFKNACYSAEKIFLYVKYSADVLNREFSNCCIKKTLCNSHIIDSDICKCATPKSTIYFIQGNNKFSTFVKGNTWLINQWSTKSHPSHFSFKMIPTGIIFNMRAKFALPRIMDRVYWQDYKTNALSEFEKNIYDISLSHKKVLVKELMFSKLNICFSDTYTNQEVQMYSHKQEHLKYFHQYSEKKLGLKNLIFDDKNKSCPPKRAVLIKRKEGHGMRSLINEKIIFDYLKFKNFSFEKVVISSKNSSLVQARTFNSFGIIISPWSSQLTNLLFAQKKTSVIIAAPFCFEDVFVNLSKICGLNTQLSIGHGSTGKIFNRPECLKSKQFYGRGCFKTWTQQNSNHNTILKKNIIERHLEAAIMNIEKCYKVQSKII